MHHGMICTACTRLRGDDGAAAVVCALAARAWLRCARGSPGREARNAASTYHALAKVKLHRARLPADVASRIDVGALIDDVGREASALSRTFKVQEAVKSLWAAATLGVRDDAIVGPLTAACVAQSRTFNAQEAANSLWAAAKLGVRDDAVVGPLTAACVALSGTFNAQEATNSLWAVETYARRGGRR